MVFFFFAVDDVPQEIERRRERERERKRERERQAQLPASDTLYPPYLFIAAGKV